MIPEVKEGRLIGLLAAVTKLTITESQLTSRLSYCKIQWCKRISYEISSKLLQCRLLHSLLEHGVDSRPAD